jgi:hypothetical protein
MYKSSTSNVGQVPSMLDVHPFTQGRALREMYSRLNDLIVDLLYITYLTQF